MSECWICDLPLGKHNSHPELWRSRDHVIPIKLGGAVLDGNIRWAHRWCNSSRGHADVTASLKDQFKRRMLAVHAKYFKRALKPAHVEGASLSTTRDATK